MTVDANGLLLDAQMRDLGYFGEREYRFAPPRRWRLDLAFPAQRVGAEIHGGVWARGHHTRGRGFIDDREKMNHALLMGWRIFEFVPAQVSDGTAARMLAEAMNGRQ